jgi:hypothetical protein
MPNNLKFNGSSIYVTTFNPPPPHNMKPLPKEHLPERHQLSEMTKIARSGNLHPVVENWGVAHIHEPDKTPTDSSSITITITPNTDNNFAGALKSPSAKNDPNMPQATLLPVLGGEAPDLPLHHESASLTQPSLTQHSYSDEGGHVTQSSYKATAHSPKVIDLTNESTERSNEPPKKRSKTTTVEVTVIVMMPGLAQSSVKKMQSVVESTDSDDDSAK